MSKTEKKYRQITEKARDVLGDAGQEGRPGDGLIFIEDGAVKVVEPEAGGKQPAITAGENVSVVINGEKLTGTRVLAAEDRVELVLRQDAPEVDFIIDLDKDCMSAFLTVTYKPGRSYRLAECPPATNVTVSARPAEEIPPSPLAIDTVLGELTAKKIIKEAVDTDKISRLLAEGKDFSKVLIAQGKRPEPPVDERIEYIYTSKQEHEEKDGYRVVNRISSVDVGEVLAEKLPPVPGKPGMDLKGKLLLPKEPKRCDLKAGRGVALTEDGLRAVAQIVGRPDVTYGLLSVFPNYVHNGDVNPMSGDIEFKGDIEVTGNVEDYMSVRAGGNVTVNGYVVNGTIYCGGDITVKGNVISSKLIAGGLSALYREIARFLSEVQVEVGKLTKSVIQLQEQMPSGKLPVGSAVKLILERKMPELTKKCAEFKKSLAERAQVNLLEEEVTNLINELALSLSLHAAEKHLSDLPSLLGLSQKVKAVLDLLERLAQKDANVSGTYVQSSTVIASCNIIIDGKGCFQSTLRAGNGVTVKGVKGIVKGGEIAADGPVHIAEAGSEAGVTTAVRTTAKHYVKIGTTWPGVKVWAGEIKKIFPVKESNVFVAGVSYQQKMPGTKYKQKVFSERRNY